jgi:hypothetical protein
MGPSLGSAPVADPLQVHFEASHGADGHDVIVQQLAKAPHHVAKLGTVHTISLCKSLVDPSDTHEWRQPQVWSTLCLALDDEHTT